MIKKLIATPFQVIFRSEESLENQIENYKFEIDFLRRKSQHLETDVYLEYCNSKIIDLEEEVAYYEDIIELKNNRDYIYGLLGGEIVSLGAVIAGVGIGLCIKKITKK